MKITSAIKIYLAIVIVSGLLILAASGVNYYVANTVSDDWRIYSTNNSEQVISLRLLRQQLGFESMIHHFKDYLFYHKQEDRSMAQNYIGGARAILEKYLTFNIGKDEIKALNEIKQTVTNYESMLNEIDKLYAQGKSIRYIDEKVKVDDTQAFAALDFLEKQVFSNDPLSHENRSSLLNRIRKDLGYGGLIHFYKNYILRQDKKLKELALLRINQISGLISKYRLISNLSTEEKNALTSLSEGLAVYKKNIDKITLLIQQNKSPLDISRALGTNDAVIVNAMMMLEKQALVKNHIFLTTMQHSINSIVRTSHIVEVLTFLLVAMISLISYGYIKLRITNPFTALIYKMNELAKSKTEINIPYQGEENEIGEMARAIEFFKENIKKRFGYEKQMKQVNQDLEHMIATRTMELDKSRKYLQAIVDSALDAIITINRTGSITSVNAAAVKMFGYQNEELVGQKINMLMPEKDQKLHDGYLRDFSGRESKSAILGNGRELFAVKKSGDEFPVEITVNEVKHDGDIMFTGIIRDISERRLHEEQLRRSQKMDALGKLTGGIAHDYNNMLGVILGYSELLQESLKDNNSLNKYASEIHKAGERGVNLTSKLLNFSRDKQGSQSVVVNINEILSGMENMLKKTLTARIELRLRLEENLNPVLVDISDFENAIINLCINAMHAIKSNGEIEVSTENIVYDSYLMNMLNVEEGDYIRISIRDSGHGMDAQTIEHIFEPFFSTKADKGTGLGLSQVYGFVQRSKGTIKVYSEVGTGSTFNIYLPRHKDIVKSGVTPLDSTVEVDDFSGTENVLVVDDEEGLLTLAEEILTGHGYQVLTASSANDALALLKSRQDIQLVISDIVMPGMDGVEFANRIREEYPDIKIQLASGFNASINESRNSYNILKKPYSSKELLHAVRLVLDTED